MIRIGMGGSVVALPILMSPIFALSQHAATGTTMAVALCTSVGSCIAYGCNQVGTDSTAGGTSGVQGVPPEDSARMDSDGKTAGSSNSVKESGKQNITTVMQKNPRHDVFAKGRESAATSVHPISPVDDHENKSTGNIDLPTAAGISISAALFAVVGARLSRRLSASMLGILQGISLMLAAPTVPYRESIITYWKGGSQTEKNSSSGTDNSLSQSSTQWASIASTDGLVPAERISNTFSSTSKEGDNGSQHGHAQSEWLRTGTSMPSFTRALFSSTSKEGDNGSQHAQSEWFRTGTSMPSFTRALFIGMFSGTYAGLLGVGGGVVMVPTLCLFTELDYKTALGTSLAAMLPTAFSGSVTHWYQGTMVRRLAVPIGLGSIVGAYLGGLLANKVIDEAQLKTFFAGVMALLGAKSLHGGVRLLLR